MIKNEQELIIKIRRNSKIIIGAAVLCGFWLIEGIFSGKAFSELLLIYIPAIFVMIWLGRAISKFNLVAASISSLIYLLPVLVLGPELMENAPTDVMYTALLFAQILFFLAVFYFSLQSIVLIRQYRKTATSNNTPATPQMHSRAWNYTKYLVYIVLFLYLCGYVSDKLGYNLSYFLSLFN